MALSLLPKRGSQYDDEQPEEKNRFSPLTSKKSDDGLEDSWNADTSGYDESNPASKSKKPTGEAEASAGDVSTGMSSALSGAEQAMAGGLAKNFGPAATAVPQTRLLGKLVGRLNKRNSAVGFGLGSAFAIIFFIILSAGPLKLVHLGSLLEQFHMTNNVDFMDGRSSRFIRYLRDGNVQNLRLGRTGTKYAQKWDIELTKNTGLRAVYDSGSRRFVGYEVVDENKAKSFLDNLEADGINTNGTLNIDGFDGSNNPVNRGGRFIDVSKEKFATKRSLIKTVSSGLKIDGVPSSVSSRLLIRYAGVDFSPLKNLRRKATDSVIDWGQKVRQERAERIANGVREPTPDKPGTDNDGDGEFDTTDDGSPEQEASREGSNAVDDTADIRDNPTSPDTPSKKISLTKSIGGKILGGGAAAVGILCTVKALGGAAELVQYANVILPMARFGMLYMAIASQQKAGINLSSDEINVYAQDLFDVVSKLDVFAAAPLQAAVNGVRAGPDIQPEFKPGKLGEKPAFFSLIDSIPILGTACAIDNFIGGLPIIKQFGEFTGAALDAALRPIGLAPSDLVDSVVNVLAGSAINLYAVGAELGNYLMYGSRIAANMLGISTGGNALTVDESGQLKQQQKLDLIAENKEKSFFARYFDTQNSDSLTTKLALSTPTNLQTAAKTLSTNPTSLLGGLIPKASADYEYDYGFPEYGYSLAEQQSDIAENPFENAAVVEPRIAELDSKFGDCFSKRIDPTTLEMTDHSMERLDVIQDKCNEDSDDLLRYRLYLADRLTESSLACYEGDKASCNIVGFSNSTSAGPSTTSLNAPGLNGYAVPCSGDPRPVVRSTQGGHTRADWTGVPTSGVIGTTSDGKPINVYIREACETTNARTVLIVSSIHGSENGGQLIGHELLFNATLPPDVRIIVVPELNKYGIDFRTQNGYGGRINANGVNLNRNANYRWSEMDGDIDNTTQTSENNFRGEFPGSEPETQAITTFISSLGKIHLSLHYHDNLNWVGASHSQIGVPFAREYGRVANMPVGNEGGERILQKGSLDGWQAERSGDPVLLVELSDNQSEPIIQKNVDAILSIINGDLLK